MCALKKKNIVFVSIILFFLFLGYYSYGNRLSWAWDDIPYANLFKRISMDFKDASLKDVLKIFSHQSGLNFVDREEIEDIILTLYLDNVTVKQALDKLLSANNLIYELDPESNIFVVKRSLLPPIKTITKVFRLKFARVPGLRMSKEISAIMKLEEDSAIGTEEEEKRNIVEIIKNLLTKYGTIDVDPRTNSLIITDIPEKFSVIEKVIAELDTPLPQVMIEVEMLDVSKNAVDELGIKWPTSIVKLDIPGARATSFPFTGKHKPKTSYTWTEFTSPGGYDWSGNNVSMKDFVPTILKVVDKELALDFLKTFTDTKFLARPRLLTLDNETAEIRIATDEAIGVKTTVASSTEGVSTGTAEAERTETGIVLRVTPRVNLESREITMVVYPKVAEAVRGEEMIIQGNTYQYRNPEERSTKSIIRVKDGETLLIGGLIRSKEDGERTEVPFFSKIPLLGMLFRHKSKTENERELVIFITPHILTEIPTSLSKGMRSSSILSFELDREQSLSSRELEIERLLKQYEK
jgi:type IV pilus assembly protein PilQ